MLLLLLALNFLHANEIFRADGWATSTVAEYVVMHDARSRLWSAARAHCEEGTSPAYIQNSGLCQATYSNHLWRAHCFGDFVCQESHTTGPDYGPWKSQSEELEFYFVPGKMSWWKAEAACANLGAELPTLETMRRNFVYLNGTSPIGKHLKGLEPSGYPEIWTIDQELHQQAWAYNPDFPTNAQTFRQDQRLAVVCVGASVLSQ